MSEKARAWARKQTAPCPASKAVLLELAAMANADDVCWPSNRCLGSVLQVTPRSIQRSLLKLKAAGLVVVSARTPVIAECLMPIVFEIDSCWRHESLLKLGRVGEDALKLWIYYGQRPRPLEPTEPGFRRLNILRIEPWRLGVRDGRRVVELAPGPWPELLFPGLAPSADGRS